MYTIKNIDFPQMEPKKYGKIRENIIHGKLVALFV